MLTFQIIKHRELCIANASYKGYEHQIQPGTSAIYVNVWHRKLGRASDLYWVVVTL